MKNLLVLLILSMVVLGAVSGQVENQTTNETINQTVNQTTNQSEQQNVTTPSLDINQISSVIQEKIKEPYVIVAIIAIIAIIVAVYFRNKKLRERAEAFQFPPP